MSESEERGAVPSAETIRRTTELLRLAKHAARPRRGREAIVTREAPMR